MVSSGSSIYPSFPTFHPQNLPNFDLGNQVFPPPFSDLEFRVRPGRNSTTPGTSGLPRNFRPPELPSLPRNFLAKQKVYPQNPQTPGTFSATPGTSGHPRNIRSPELPELGTSGPDPGTSGLTRNFPRNFSISLLHRFHHNFSLRTPI